MGTKVNQFIDVPTKKLNRLSSRLPDKGRFWCNCCDRDQVGHGEKCRVCGVGHKTYKMHRREIP